MIILGGGLSGLLCGALNPGSVIYEAGPDRPSDHKAVLRMKSNEISRLTGIPFKEVCVHKAIWYDGEEVQPAPRFSHMYSKKVSGTISARSITNIDSGQRFIPPDDFVEQLKARCKIEYDSKLVGMAPFELDFDWGPEGYDRDNPIVSTIPMPALMGIVESTRCAFDSAKIVVDRYEIDDCDSYTTIYYPDPRTDVYRATIDGNILIVESIRSILSIDLEMVFRSMGISPECGVRQVVNSHIQELGKITPINQKTREKFILDMTLKYGVYSLGRFATWRPKVMMDDLVDDIFHIRRLITGGHYAAINHKQGEK